MAAPASTGAGTVNGATTSRPASAAAVRDSGSSATGTQVTNPPAAHEYSVVISVLDHNPRNLHFAQQLCINLNLHGIGAFLLPHVNVARRAWFKEKVRLIQSSILYIPFMDERWLRFDECLLEVFYALRGQCVSAHPLVVPVLDRTMTQRIQMSDSDEELLALVQDACPCIDTADAPRDAAVKVVNYLRGIGVELPTQSAATGVGASTVFATEWRRYSSNKPNSGVMKALQAIESPISCEALDLGRLFFADSGAHALGPIFRMLPALVKVDLSDNGINNAGCHLLCAYFRTHPSITDISLARNDISIAGVADVLFLLQENQRITHVDIVGNPVYSAVWEGRVAAAAARNSKLLGQREKFAAATAASKLGSHRHPHHHHLPGSPGSPVSPVAIPGQPNIAVCLDIVHNTETDAVCFKARIGDGYLAHSVALSVPPAATAAATTPPLMAAAAELTRQFSSIPVALQMLSIGRLNGKSLKFLLEQTPPPAGFDDDAESAPKNDFFAAPPRTEDIARFVMQWLSEAPPADPVAAALAGRRPVVGGSRAAPTTAEAVCRADVQQQERFGGSPGHDVTLRLERSDSTGPFFLEVRLGFDARGVLLQKSLAQVYRPNMPCYSGNLRDEVMALLLDVVQDEVDGDQVTQMDQAIGEEDEADAEYEAAVSSAALGAWTGPAKREEQKGAGVAKTATSTAAAAAAVDAALRKPQ